MFCGSCGTSLGRPVPGPDPHAPSPDPYPSAAQPGAFPPPAQPGAGVPFAHRQTNSYRLDLNRLSRVDRVVGAASVVVFISMFLPWFGLSLLGETVSESGTTAHGYLVIPMITALGLTAYLVIRAGWDELPFSLPLAHARLLLIGTGLQFLLVFIGFADRPASQLSWEFGAYLALIASVTAAAPVVAPAIRSWQANR